MRGTEPGPTCAPPPIGASGRSDMGELRSINGFANGRSLMGVPRSMNAGGTKGGPPACGTPGCIPPNGMFFPLMSWAALTPAWSGRISAPKRIPRHSTLINPPATLCSMCIATPLTLCIIKNQRSIDHLIAGGSTDYSVPHHRTQPSDSVNGVTRLSRRGKYVMEITTWPHASSAPMHSTNPCDAFRRQHLETVVCKIDMLEDANADCLARLIQ